MIVTTKFILSKHNYIDKSCRFPSYYILLNIIINLQYFIITILCYNFDYFLIYVPFIENNFVILSNGMSMYNIRYILLGRHCGRVGNIVSLIFISG